MTKEKYIRNLSYTGETFEEAQARLEEKRRKYGNKLGRKRKKLSMTEYSH